MTFLLISVYVNWYWPLLLALVGFAVVRACGGIVVQGQILSVYTVVPTVDKVVTGGMVAPLLH